MDADATAPGAAYEDHWYRSMKALAEQPEAAPADDAAPLLDAAVAEADVLARAEQLLARLRRIPTPGR